MAKFPPIISLSKQERYRFCDLKLFKMLNVLMIADSKSYTLIDENMCQEAREEFESSYQILVSEWQECDQNRRLR